MSTTNCIWVPPAPVIPEGQYASWNASTKEWLLLKVPTLPIPIYDSVTNAYAYPPEVEALRR
jgi:hypothetical protein